MSLIHFVTRCLHNVGLVTTLLLLIALLASGVTSFGCQRFSSGIVMDSVEFTRGGLELRQEYNRNDFSFLGSAVAGTPRWLYRTWITDDYKRARLYDRATAWELQRNPTEPLYFDFTVRIPLFAPLLATLLLTVLLGRITRGPRDAAKRGSRPRNAPAEHRPRRFRSAMKWVGTLACVALFAQCLISPWCGLLAGATFGNQIVRLAARHGGNWATQLASPTDERYQLEFMLHPDDGAGTPFDALIRLGAQTSTVGAPTEFYLPLWPLLILLLPPLIAIWAADIRHWRARARGCKACGYDLTGNTSGRCPECGASTKAADIAPIHPT